MSRRETVRVEWDGEWWVVFNRDGVEYARTTNYELTIGYVEDLILEAADPKILELKRMNTTLGGPRAEPGAVAVMCAMNDHEAYAMSTQADTQLRPKVCPCGAKTYEWNGSAWEAV